MHVNTQSMVSTFDDLVFAIERFNFDVVCMSETWLKDSNLLLQHVYIPGYTQLFNNRTKARGGGVGMYVRETIKFKIRTDLINKFPSLEHLWIEIPGHNKHSRLLLGVVYRSESTASYGDWLDYFESLLSDLIVSWDGMLLVTGDFNIDLLQPSNAKVKKYIDLLQSMNLDQLVTKATRTTKTSATLIDHMITNMSTQVTHCDVLTNLMISDHDAPYICLNVRTTRLIPRFKFIRHEENFDAVTFCHDFEQLPLSIVYSTDDPDTQVELLTNLICECLERHAPLKRTKISRPPEQWLKHPDVQLLQMECHNLRSRMRKDKSEKLWAQYREKRNLLKTSIRKSKSEFYQKALSSSRIVWQTIHRILHPNPQPLRIDPDELNKHYVSTAERATGASSKSIEELGQLLDSFPEDNDSEFRLREFTHREVLSELKNLRSDCPWGPDNIPVKFIKLVAEHLASPLTHILNNCIAKSTFPSLWKIARISASPKEKEIKCNDDLRPISILPTLSKVYERLVLR